MSEICSVRIFFSLNPFLKGKKKKKVLLGEKSHFGQVSKGARDGLIFISSHFRAIVLAF